MYLHENISIHSFILLQWEKKAVKWMEKCLFSFTWVITNHQLQQYPRIRHDQCLILLYYLHQKIMAKKSEILKKRNFLDQALDFLPPRKPGLYISLVDFFFFKYHEHTLSSGQNLSKSWYLWPNLETFLVKTIPRFAFAGRCPLLNYYLNKRYFNIYPEI